MRGVDLHLEAGECLAVVGESGSGKSTLVRAVLGLLPAGTTATGAVLVTAEDGPVDVLAADRKVLRRLRGRTLGYVAQDPHTALDPVRSVGHRLREAWLVHGVRSPRGDVVRRAEALGIDDAARRLHQRPHQWSGGMLQCAAIAAAGALRPAITLADEPTASLDTTTAAEITPLLRTAADEGAAVIVVSHDTDRLAALSDRVARMDGGHLTATASTRPERAT